MTRICAFDLSLTGTGWAVRGEHGRFANSGVFVPKTTGFKRLAWLRDKCLDIAGPFQTIAIEGYSFGSQNKREAMGELGGVVRLALWEAGKLVVDIPPSSLKTFATGKGNAGKPEMLAAAIQRLNYVGHNADEVDALWLAAMLGYFLDGAPQVVPLAHNRAFKKIKWPVSFEPMPA